MMSFRHPKPLCCLVMGAVAVPAILAAQSYETGGIQLTFGTTFRLEATDNKGLRADADKSGSLDAVAGLSFGLLTATPASSFAVNASGEARAGTSADASGITAPRLSTAYNRSSADSTLDLSATFSQTDLSRNEAVVADDIGLAGIVTGTAIRRAVSARAGLTWGLTSRISYGLSAAVDKVTYTGGSATGLDGTALQDNRRLTLGGTSELDLTKAAHLTLGLSYSIFDEDGARDTSDTTTLTTGLSIDRPLGTVGATLGVTDSNAGQRYSVSAGRTLALPSGTVSGQIGVSLSDRGSTALIGSIGASRDLPDGALNFELSRDVSVQNEQDSEQLTTQLSLAYTRSLTPLSGLEVGFNLAQVEDTQTTRQSQDATLGATYTRSLTPDWSAAAGYSYRYAKDDPGVTARSNTVFLQLRRSFVTRY
ncbi:hypothetical protein [Loktanella sp. M215]|uniref:hypothetical protein n=1 Tax=Loktanella sp. M215 TaxID=2675431 RepID=UPI001F2D161C|nr:hypothetical protein [Loktanella sp. M215]MCF7702189.1 hypothetical protein [Loktanella sp. M215]